MSTFSKPPPQSGQPLNSSLASISMGTGIAGLSLIVMSVLCCLPLVPVGVPFAIAAIVTGIQARIKIRDGRASGEGMAWTGIGNSRWSRIALNAWRNGS